MRSTRASSPIDRWLGIDGDSPGDLALIEERLAVLQPRMPWLYAMMLSCQVGMTFTFEAERDPPLEVIVVAVLTALRGLKWLKMRREHVVGEAARKRLRAIGIASLVTSFIFMLVIAQFLPGQAPDKRQMIMVMTATCTNALATPMRELTSSARMSYILFGIPGALIGTLAGDERAAGLLRSICCWSTSSRSACSRSRIAASSSRSQCGSPARRHAGAPSGLRSRKEVRRASWRRAISLPDWPIGGRSWPHFRNATWRTRAACSFSTSMASRLWMVRLGIMSGTKCCDRRRAVARLREWAAAGVIGGATAARLAGDEFAVLIPAMSASAVEAQARVLLTQLTQPYPIGDAVTGISACCGIATLAAGERDASTALRVADLALYRAKAKERGMVVHYSSEMGAMSNAATRSRRRFACPGSSMISIYFTSRSSSCGRGQVVAYEALARWTHERLGAIAPSDFILMTEQMQSVGPISLALLGRATRAALAWAPDQGLSFNLRAAQLCSWGSAQRVLCCVEDAGLAPSRLQMEVIETAIMADFATARHNLAALQERGVRIALDDFGAGHASINYLREMRFDELKLDGSLLAASQTSEGAAAQRSRRPGAGNRDAV